MDATSLDIELAAARLAEQDAQRQAITDIEAEQKQRQAIIDAAGAEQARRQTVLSGALQHNTTLLQHNAALIVELMGLLGNGPSEWLSKVEEIRAALDRGATAQWQHADSASSTQIAVPFEPGKSVSPDEFFEHESQIRQQVGGARAQFKNALSAETVMIEWVSRATSDGQRRWRAGIFAAIFGYLPNPPAGYSAQQAVDTMLQAGRRAPWNQ